MDNLLLVRHGQSEANARGIFPGRMQFPLTKEGREQAEFLSKFLSQTNISAIYSSPMLRTFQTAQIIARPHNLRIEIREGLIERDVGALQGKPILKKHRGWLEVAGYRESFPQMERRVAAELSGIAKNSSGNVVVVSHGDPIRAAIYHFLGIPAKKDSKYVMSIDCASLSVLSFRHDNPRLVLFNYSKSTEFSLD